MLLDGWVTATDVLIKTPKKNLKIAPMGLGGGGPNFIFFSEFLLFFFRAHAKI
jgi:hypothetical protein